MLDRPGRRSRQRGGEGKSLSFGLLHHGPRDPTNQLFNCAEANDTHGVGLIAGKLDDNLGSIARLTGEVGKLTFTQINNTMINNFANSPAYIKLVEVVLEQLSDLPERRAAIVDAIRNLNDDPPTRSSFLEEAKPSLSLQCETIEGEATCVE